MRFLPILLLASTLQAAIAFRPQEIQRDFGVVYAVLTADINSDGKPDIVAINPTQVVWFENPRWQKHVILDGVTKKDNVCMAASDIDGDGKLDLALGADWQPTNTTGGGSLQWIGGKSAAAGGQWAMTPIADEPTLHRMRWGDIDGDGKPELIVAPLHGRGTKGPRWDGPGARILVFHVPKDPARDPWPVETADGSLHIVHNLIVTNFDDDKQEEILTASREGVHLLKRGAGGKWSKTLLGAGGNPGEIKLGRIGGRRRAIATVEPWHGNSIAIYEEPVPPMNPQGAPDLKTSKLHDGMKWPRQVIEDQLAGAHALGWGDFDGDGSDELAVGWREKNFGVALYNRSREGKWSRQMMVDDGGVAVEDLTVADLNGDGRPEIIAAGRKTQNVKIYWNETRQDWSRHEITSGYMTQTAVAADFTGDGKVDAVVNNPGTRQTILYVAPGWKPVVLHTGVNAIHSAAMDVDGDGFPDYIGARYSPGLIFWLRRPKDPLRDAWEYHVIDDSAQAGVDGIHGLTLGDVDGDGKLDVIGNSALPKGPYASSIAWFKVPRNPRQAARWERNVFASGDAPGLSHYMGFGDVNGDKRPDIASGAKTAAGGNWFAWWEAPKNPRGIWKKHLIAENQEGATNIAMADVNRDGKMDFIASRGHGMGVVWYEAPKWTPHEIDPSLGGPHSLAIG
ncbi:MAG: VCBS repeat-containing protein, partial [Bryobacteraceae bacterium]